MKRDDAITKAYGRRIPQGELNALSIEMNRDMDSFIAQLTQATGLVKHEAYYFFLGRIGTNYEDYSFYWEPFRDFAGPLLRTKESIPVVFVSSPSELNQPVLTLAKYPSPHYQIAISPRCNTRDIANLWLETLADATAIPIEGGENFYKWFFTNLELSPDDLSPKARRFVNLFANI